VVTRQHCKMLLTSEIHTLSVLLIKVKAFPVTGRGGLQGCEMLRTPCCLEKELTDGGKAVNPTHRPFFTPQKHYFSASGTHFC
jgi:hypothetical protein